MHVVVVGGGIGGLALARGLRRAGTAVTVLERDTDLTRTGGYKLHLHDAALDALGEVLGARDLARLLAVSAASSRQGPFVVADHRDRELLRVPQDGVDVDRVTLRLALAERLGDNLRLGVHATGVGTASDGRPEVLLDDGTTLTPDVVVAADGSRSRVAAARAGGSTSRPVGLVGVAGHTAVGALPPDVVRRLGDGSALAVGPGGVGLYRSFHDPRAHAAAPDPGDGDGPAPAFAPGWIWGLIADETVAGDLPSAGTVALRDHALRLLVERCWHPAVCTLVGHVDVGGVGAYAFRAGPADAADVAPWPAGRVTALGDAVHAMPPTGGRGAATALLDARDLARALTQAPDGSHGTVSAIARYERSMRVDGAAAVAESLQPVRWIRASSRPPVALGLRGALPVVAGAAALTRALRRRGRRPVGP